MKQPEVMTDYKGVDSVNDNAIKVVLDIKLLSIVSYSAVISFCCPFQRVKTGNK